MEIQDPEKKPEVSLGRLCGGSKLKIPSTTLNI